MSTMAERIARLEANSKTTCDMVAEIHRVVVAGNGQPSLCSRMTLTEERVAELRHAQKMSLKLKLAIIVAVVSSFASGVMGFASMFLFRCS